MMISVEEPNLLMTSCVRRKISSIIFITIHTSSKLKTAPSPGSHANRSWLIG